MSKGNGHATAAFGVQYQSVLAMCADHGVSYHRVRRLLAAGLTPERAIEEAPIDKPAITDHKGTTYPTISAMCDAWGVDLRTYTHRINTGWSIADALESTGGPRKCIDHTGKVYRNMSEMARAWGLKISTLTARIRDLKWPIERALTEPAIKCIVGRDHKGNKYASVNAMCRAYGIPTGTVTTRLTNGWQLEAALTTKAAPRRNVLNVLTPEELAHADQLGLLRPALAARLRAGWLKERAINTPPIPAGAHRKCSVCTEEEEAILKSSGVSRQLFLYRLRKNWARDSAMRLPPGAGYDLRSVKLGRRKKAVNNTAKK